MRTLTTGVVLTLAMAAGGAGAQELTFGGQVRPRAEFRSADWFDTDLATAFTSMRTRLWLRAALPSDVTAFVQLQDVRLWGEELSTTDPVANALDLHQGWVELGDPGEGRAALRLGRQELAYGEERLVGALDWVQQARSFDGGRFRGRWDDIVIDAFAMRLSEDEVFPEDASFLGVYGTLPAAGSLDLYALYNSVGDDVTDQATLGARWSSERAPLRWRVEAAYQTGTRLTEDVAAYLLALRAGVPFDALGDGGVVELWYDRLSGDDDPLDGEVRVFDTLFATNHKFYGTMDLFTNIPLHTGGRGLQDLALKASVPRGDVALAADLHGFWLAAADGLESGHLGEELDLSARWAYAPGVGVSGGLSLFAPGDAWPTDEVQSWMFVMLDVVF